MIHPLDLTGYSKEQVWCVPSAVSLITGAPLAETTKRFAFMLDKKYKKVSGVPIEAGLLALWEAGWRGEAVDLWARYPECKIGPTLERYIRERPRKERFAKLLIRVPGHVIVAHGSYLFDNWRPKGATIDKFPKPKRHVTHVWILTPR